MPAVCNELEDRDTPEKVSCIHGKINDPLTFAAASSFCGRRAMVKKFWCQEILRKWLFKKAKPPHARLFTEPHCQNYTTAWYLLYRWCIFGAWASIVVCSIFEIGSYKPLFSYDKWPIYLTNWDLALGVTQALLGACLVTKRWRRQKVSTFDPSSMRLGKAETFYWFLYVVTSTIALGVTISYWCAVYNPKIHVIDPLNIMLHVCNSILMIVDLSVSNVPFRLRSFWWALSVVLFYLIFSVIYYSSGGLDKLGRHYIYGILDWKKPGRTLLICIGGLAFVIVLHCGIYFLIRLRTKMYTKITRNSRKAISIDSDGNEPVVEKQAEIV